MLGKRFIDMREEWMKGRGANLGTLDDRVATPPTYDTNDIGIEGLRPEMPGALYAVKPIGATSKIFEKLREIYPSLISYRVQGNAPQYDERALGADAHPGIPKTRTGANDDDGIEWILLTIIKNLESKGKVIDKTPSSVTVYLSPSKLDSKFRSLETQSYEKAKKDKRELVYRFTRDEDNEKYVLTGTPYRGTIKTFADSITRKKPISTSLLTIEVQKPLNVGNPSTSAEINFWTTRDSKLALYKLLRELYHRN